MTVKFVCSLITVTDVNRSRDFYQRLLNQEVKFDFGENVTFQSGFAIHQKAHFQGLIDNREIKTRCNNFELYFEYDDLELIVDRLNDYGVTFVHPIREQPWRQKVVRFYDPDDYIIEIGETMQHVSSRLHHEGISIDQIASITNMPQAFVVNSIQNHNNDPLNV